MIPDTEAIRDEHVRRDICGIVSEFESALSEIDETELDRLNHLIWVELAERQDAMAQFKRSINDPF